MYYISGSSVLNRGAFRRQNIQLGQGCGRGRFHRLYTLLRWLGGQDLRSGTRGTFQQTLALMAYPHS